MLGIAFAGIAIFLALFALFVASRPSAFRYERSGLINANPQKIFPYLNSFKLGSEWSPYEKMDATMKKTLSGPEQGVGAIMEFVGDQKAGSGRLEILKSTPHSLVELRLEMLKPMRAVHLVQYSLIPEGNATRFTWTMSGEAGFMGKLFALIVDCDKLAGTQFNHGIQNLKTVVEAQS